MQELNINHISKKIENKRVLVAVSGGADSMVLLSLLLRMQENINFYMEVVHINHNLRGRESDCDAKLVSDFSKMNNVPCKIKSINVLKNMHENKQTLEQSARELRYNAIYEYKEEGKFDYIIIAHNSDDQAETVLMHICRGSGLKGASGIRKREDLIRPLMNYSKAQILDYANNYNIPYRNDSSNLDVKYSRNYVRHEILPRLEQIYPSVKSNLIRFAEIAKSDDDFINSLIDFSVIKEFKDCIKISSKIFNLHEAVYTRLIYKVINSFGIFADVEQKHIGLIKDVADLKNGSSICLPHGLNVFKEYDNLVFTLKKIKTKSNEYVNYQMGEIIFENTLLEITEVSSDDVNFGDGSLYFDLDSIPSNAVFRNKEDGDVIHKLGSGTKKFSDYLTDKKVPLRIRDKIIVLAHENKILLSIGFDISDSIKITSNTSRIGKLVVKKN